MICPRLDVCQDEFQLTGGNKMLTKIVLPENAEHNDGWNECTDAESVQNCRRVDAFQIRLQHIRDQTLLVKTLCTLVRSILERASFCDWMTLL